MVKKKIEQYQDKIARLFPQKSMFVPANPKDRSLARTITFQVTDNCNLCCSYCYQINKNHHVMLFDTAKRFIDMLLDADEASNEYINPTNSPAIIIEFIGGEPFLEIDLIDQITDYFIEQMIIKQHKWATRFMISICSNGVLYFNDKVQAYIKKHMHHMSFSISIDGNRELHNSCRVFPDGSGSYDIAIAGVKHFTEVLHGTMGSKMTLAPANIAYTYEATKSLIENGYTDINMNCVYERGWEQCHATELYYQLKKLADYMLKNNLVETHYVGMFVADQFHPKVAADLQNWCGGNGAMISVDYKGDIYPCIRYMESSLGEGIEPLIIGNVYDGIMSTECQKDCVHCLRSIDRRTQSTDECFNCPIAEGCSWCTAYNYQEFGTPDKRATYICEMHKARALSNVYLWNSYFLKTNQNKSFKNYVPDEWALKIIPEEELNMLKNIERKSYYE